MFTTFCEHLLDTKPSVGRFGDVTFNERRLLHPDRTPSFFVRLKNILIVIYRMRFPIT